MNAKIVHVLAVVVSLVTTVSASVLAVTGDLPTSWRPDAVLAVAIAGVVLTALKTAEAQISVAKIQAVSGPQAGLDAPTGLVTVPTPVAAGPTPDAVAQEIA